MQEKLEKKIYLFILFFQENVAQKEDQEERIATLEKRYTNSWLKKLIQS